MNHRHTALVFAIAMCVATASAAAAFDMAAFEKNVGSLAAYTAGQSPADLGFIENAVAQASKDPSVRGPAEQKLLEALDAATTADAKSFICRQLWIIGTAAAVPRLEKLLADRELSHMARYALAGMNAPEASQALRRALGTTSGWIKAGIIDTLVQRGCRAALPDVAPLAGAADREVALAAAKALGRFGGAEAVKALEAARAAAPEPVAIEIDDALLACAEKLRAEGKNEDAAKVYAEFYPSGRSEQLRVAGLRGLAATRGDKAADLLVAAIKGAGSDAALRRNAIAMLALLENGAPAGKLAELYGALGPEDQELVVRAAASRGDAAAIVMDAVKNQNAAVRVAALDALGDAGTPEAFAALARTAATGEGREKDVARASLTRLRGPDIEAAFVRGAEAGDAACRVEVIQAIGRRTMRGAFEPLAKIAAGDADAAVRREAIIAMGRVGTRAGLGNVLALVAAPKEDQDRGAAAEAARTLFRTAGNKDGQAGAVIAALASAPAGGKAELLRLLAVPATPQALEAVRAVLQDQDLVVRDAAFATLGDWPNAEPAADLFAIASGSGDAAQKAAALRAFVRIAPYAEDSTPLFVKALELAATPDEVKFVLDGMGKADTCAALSVAEGYMTKDEFRAEACRAAVRIARNCCWEDSEKTRAVLAKVAAATQDGGLKEEIGRITADMDRWKSHIFAWRGAGPFTLEDVQDGPKVFGTAFPPESPDAKDVAWVRVKTHLEGERINLEATFGPIDFCCAYLRTVIVSPVEQEARLEFGADDYAKAWLNGAPAGAGTVKLKKGDNPLMLKAGDHGGGWNFFCRITQPGGGPIEGLRFEPR